MWIPNSLIAEEITEWFGEKDTTEDEDEGKLNNLRSSKPQIFTYRFQISKIPRAI